MMAAQPKRPAMRALRLRLNLRDIHHDQRARHDDLKDRGAALLARPACPMQRVRLDNFVRVGIGCKHRRRDYPRSRGLSADWPEGGLPWP